MSRAQLNPLMLVAWYLAACGCSSEPGPESLGQLRESIVGGVPSTDDQNAAVLIVRGQFVDWCSAAVVAPTLILTARHCLYFSPLGENATSRCGLGRVLDTPVVNAWPPETFSVYVGKQRPLPDPVAHGTRIYSGNDLDLCDNDVALLEVDTPLPVPPLALRLDAPPSVGEEGTLVGWGATQLNERLPDARQQRDVTVEVLGPANYAPPGGAPRMLTESDFAGTEAGCRGDSGAPLLSQATGAIIGVHEGSTNTDPVVNLDEENAVSQCFDSSSLYQRLDLQEDWLRGAFHAAGSAPWLEGHPQPAELGQPCGSKDDCLSGLCVRAAESSFCSVRCDSEPCPDGMSCIGPSSDRICALAPLVQSATAAANGCALDRTQCGAGPCVATLCLFALRARRRRLQLGKLKCNI